MPNGYGIRLPKIGFIPRTLYELMYIRLTIEEDIYHNDTCSFSQCYNFKYDQNEINKKRKERGCWHGPPIFEIKNENTLNDYIVRFHNIITDRLTENITYEDIIIETQININFLKNIYKNINVDKNLKIPSVTFSGTCYGGAFETLAIINDMHENIILNIIKLECNTSANSIILYRGGNYKLDNISNEMKEINRSLSYGLGLFSGAIYDPGACPFNFIRKDENDGYCIILNNDEHPFFIPCLNIIESLHGKGEIFHPRTLLPKNYMGYIHGMFIINNKYLCSKYDKHKLQELYDQYKLKAIFLK